MKRVILLSVAALVAWGGQAQEADPRIGNPDDRDGANPANRAGANDRDGNRGQAGRDGPRGGRNNDGGQNNEGGQNNPPGGPNLPPPGGPNNPLPPPPPATPPPPPGQPPLPPPGQPPEPPPPEPDDLDEELRALITAEGLMGDATFNRSIPAIDDPLPQLGMKLFFSKSLGGEFDTACVSCHHPALGGDDDLSLPVGVHAMNSEVVGADRRHVSGLPNVPRNSPTFFNVALWDTGLFWDTRVESFGKEPAANGAASDIRTPDVAFGNVDGDAGATLAAAQARFPVTSADEMRGGFEAGGSNADVRDHLAARLGGYGEGAGELDLNDWLAEFQAAYFSNEPAEALVTFDNIAHAIGEYERSATFAHHDFGRYVAGDLSALSAQQKRGAVLFFTPAEDGGGGCAGCHAGDLFSDGEHRLVAFPQIGPGTGDGAGDDFGRERETGSIDDRYRFRTPSLLNVAITAPYGHAGAYESLGEVLRHYNNPRGTVDGFFGRGGWCDLDQFADVADCETLYPDAQAASDRALDTLRRARGAGNAQFTQTNLNGQERADIVAFLNSLTDPCVTDRDCVAAWIPDGEGPDGRQVIATDGAGNPL